MGSADWMPRNLDRRVEILFPVENEELMERVKGILELQLRDNVKSYILQKDGNYDRIDKRGKELVNSQEEFCRQAKNAIEKKEDIYQQRVFVPSETAD